MAVGEKAADEAAAVERIGGKQVESAKQELHPNKAADHARSAEQGEDEDLDAGVGSESDGDENESGGEVGNRTGEDERVVSGALVGVFLAFGVGVGEQGADGEQQDGAQAQAQAGSDDETRNFAHGEGTEQHEIEGEPAAHAGRAGDTEEDDSDQGNKNVHAQFNACPLAQGN